MAPVSGIQKAVDKFDGSPTKLAAALGGKVKRQHVEHWIDARRVPAEHCNDVKDLTGVPLWELRPEDWHRVWKSLVGTKGAPPIPEPADEKAGAN